MNKLQLLTLGCISGILVITGLIAQYKSNDKVYTLESDQLVTLREWNTCVSTKVPTACCDAPKEVHSHCYDAVINTTDCLLLVTTDNCKKFNTFQYDKTNLDIVLPQAFLDCVQDCDSFAKYDTYYYNWYNLKYRTCSQA